MFVLHTVEARTGVNEYASNLAVLPASFAGREHGAGVRRGLQRVAEG